MAIAESTTARTPKPRRSRAGKDLSGYLFIAPSLIFIVVFVVGPIVGALWFSLTDYDLMSAPKFVGTKNYLRLLDDERFTRSLTNSLYFAFGTVPTGVVTSLLLAAMINRQIRGIYTFRALFYMPVVSSFRDYILDTGFTVPYYWSMNLWNYHCQRLRDHPFRERRPLGVRGPSSGTRAWQVPQSSCHAASSS